MKIKSQLSASIAECIKQLYGAEPEPDKIAISETRKEFEGDFTFVVFPFTSASKKGPEATASEIGEWLVKQLDFVKSFNVIKGFLNIVIVDEWWSKFIFGLHKESNLAFLDSETHPPKKNLMVEYCGPNTNKPLHLGHLRNLFIGYSVSKIQKAIGQKVHEVCIYNDRGINIAKSMLAWEKWGGGMTPEKSGKKGDHFVGEMYVSFDREFKKQVEALVRSGSAEDEAKKNAPLIAEAQEIVRKWEAGDEHSIRLWNMMNTWVYEGFNQTYKTLKIDFDQNYFESDTYLLGKKIVEEGLEKGVFYRKDDGSVWVDLTEDGLDEKLLLRGDGTSVYITQDIGTAELRFNERKLDRLVYVVANEQDYHFKVLSLVMKKLGRPWAEELYHLSYGMVDLPSGKMKSREGTVVDADELIDEMISHAKTTTQELGKTEDFSEAEAAKLHTMIGLAALRYFILKVDPKKKMLFNPEESIDFNGHTGPFIQYTYARIKSVLRKNKEDFHHHKDSVDIQPKERALISLIYQFPQVLRNAADQLNPAIVANYAYELAKSYNQFYHEHQILKEEIEGLRKFRLSLSEITGKIIHQSMKVLGIEVPERM